MEQGRGTVGHRAISRALACACAAISIFASPAFGSRPTKGRLEIIKAVESTSLGNSRDVRVWLPRDYDQESSRSFPVIYFHDGQNGFDAKTSDGGAEWKLDETLTRLSEKESLGPAIVVGIDSVNDTREQEYDPTSNEGRDYMRFVVEVVKPMIDSKYRTRANRESTWTMGSSMGASIAMGLVWNHPETFSAGAGLSLPAMEGGESLVKMIEATGKTPSGIRLYFDHGTVGGDSDYATSCEHFASALRTKGLSDFEYRVFPGADHGEGDWSKRVDVPLRWLLH
jgi:enterochelin esterase-like enzyme